METILLLPIPTIYESFSMPLFSQLHHSPDAFLTCKFQDLQPRLVSIRTWNSTIRKCENCKMLEKDKYWNDVSSTKQRFFKIMPDDFEEKLFIPQKFIECFKGKLSARCTLIGPSGNKWRVSAAVDEEYPDRVVFIDGWPEFVRDQGIGYRDFLSFCYIGPSTFNVSVFDGTGCERETTHFAKSGSTLGAGCASTLHTVKFHRNPAASESESSVKATVRKRERKNKITLVDEELAGMSEASEGDETGNGNGKCFAAQVRMKDSKGETSKKTKYSQMYYISNRRKLGKEEDQKAVVLAEITHKPKPGVPAVQITMARTHVYSGFNMTIPMKWAVKHMLDEAHEVKLRVPSVGRSWIVGCRWTSRNQCQLRKKWPTFVLDNNLEEHDACVFELIKKGKSSSIRPAIMDVYIYRVVDDIVPLTVSRR